MENIWVGWRERDTGACRGDMLIKRRKVLYTTLLQLIQCWTIICKESITLQRQGVYSLAIQKEYCALKLARAAKGQWNTLGCKCFGEVPSFLFCVFTAPSPRCYCNTNHNNIIEWKVWRDVRNSSPLCWLILVRNFTEDVKARNYSTKPRSKKIIIEGNEIEKKLMNNWLFLRISLIAGFPPCWEISLLYRISRTGKLCYSLKFLFQAGIIQAILDLLCQHF